MRAAVEMTSFTRVAPHAAEARRARFAELFTEHWPRAFRYAVRLTGGGSEAEDILQETAEEAYRAFGRYREGTRFDRWLLRILHNTFIDHVRRRRRRPSASLDALPDFAVAADRADEPEEAAQRTLDGPVQRAVLRLNPEYRAVVVLVDVMGMPYEDAASILRCPIGTVRSRLHRGRLALRDRLAVYREELRRGDWR
jgi:RNA polymerase sigma-70 factor (ECF subfamily)